MSIAGAGVGAGFGGVRWAPTSLSGLLVWFRAINNSATIVPAAAPTITNASFASWAGDNPVGWGVSAESGTNYITQSGSAARLVSDGGAMYIYQTPVLIVGNRYSAEIEILVAAMGQIKENYNGGAWAAGTGIKTQEYLAALTHLGISRNAACDVTFRNLVVSNLSRVRWNPQPAGTLSAGYVSQATAASQRWIAALGTGVGLKGDGTADRDVSNLAAASWAPLHLAAGCSIARAIYPDSDAAGNDVILDTCSHNASNVGVTLCYDATNQRVIWRVANGSGTWHVDGATANSSCLKGVKHYIDVAWDSATGYTIGVDGVEASGGVTGVASAAAATSTLRDGCNAADAEFFKGVLGSWWAATGKQPMISSRIALLREIGS